MSSVRHIALFRFVDGTTREQVLALSRGLTALPEAIAQIRAFRHGPDAGINATSWDYAVVADFDSADAYTGYRDHPVHQELIRDRVQPIVADRASVQLTLD